MHIELSEACQFQAALLRRLVDGVFLDIEGNMQCFVNCLADEIEMIFGLVLIVEDERDLVSTLEYKLQREGFQTRAAFTGQEALSLAALSPVPDLVILDLMLPDITGMEVCRKLRQTESTRNVPILMLTAKAEEIDRVVGFEIGADDYVAKPFSVRELMLRVKAILRRSYSKDEDSQQHVFGRIRVDVPAHRLWVDDQELHITILEFNLLTTLLARRGRLQSREVLLRDVWGIQASVSTRTVDAHIKRLRKKLGEAGDYIETIRGAGYRFAEKPGGEST